MNNPSKRYSNHEAYSPGSKVKKSPEEKNFKMPKLQTYSIVSVVQPGSRPILEGPRSRNQLAATFILWLEWTLGVGRRNIFSLILMDEIYLSV